MDNCDRNKEHHKMKRPYERKDSCQFGKTIHNLRDLCDSNHEAMAYIEQHKIYGFKKKNRKYEIIKERFLV